MALDISQLKTILSCKCPNCGNGDLFETPNPYKLRSLTKMYRSCPKCGADFVKEPGFYFGASYVSYALTIAIWVAVLIALITFDTLNLIEFGFLTHPGTLLISGISVLIILLPILYRVSRSIWLAGFTKRKN
jgi:uncharacterized protein (DUF983 family)